MRIKKGDNVIVIAGKDKGVKGAVVRALPQDDMVIIEGVNVKKKHQKAGRNTEQGGGGQILNVAAPIHVSNVMIVDPKGGKLTRVKRTIDAKSGKRVRVATGSGAPLD